MTAAIWQRMPNFETITLFDLDDVTGGGSSTDAVQIGIQAPIKGVPVNVGINGNTSTTDYKTCVDAIKTMPNAKPADIVQACGLPPSN
jgi:hypothetical protein